MELYTLVSLLIGIFGGTFAALNNLKNIYEKDFQQISDDAARQAQAVINLSGDGHAASDDCHRLKKHVKICSRIWKYLSVAQASFFTIAIYIVAIFALINWPEISRHHTDQELADLYDKMPFGLTPWLILLAGAVGNVLFIVLGVIVFCVCKGRFKKIIQISRYTAKPSTEPPIQPAQQA